MALVYELFTLRLDNLANESKVSIAAASDCSEPPNIIVVSSANCDKICSTSPILTPLISLFCLSIKDSTSAHSKNIYGEGGSPYLHPLPILKKSERNPHWVTADEILLYNTEIHFLIDGPNLKKSRTFPINSQDKCLFEIDN